MQRRQHQVIVQLHLNRPGVVRARNKLRDLRIRGIGYVHDSPAVIPEVSEIKVPTTIHLPDGDLERAAATIEIAVPDGPHIARLPAGGDLVGASVSLQGEEERGHREDHGEIAKEFCKQSCHHDPPRPPRRRRRDRFLSLKFAPCKWRMLVCFSWQTRCIYNGYSRSRCHRLAQFSGES